MQRGWIILIACITLMGNKEVWLEEAHVSHKVLEKKSFNYGTISEYLSEQLLYKVGLVRECRAPIVHLPQVDHIPEPSGWDGLDEIRLHRARRKLTKLSKIEGKEIGTGKGIVYVTSSVYFQITVAAILTLRTYTKLPVEVFHHDELSIDEIETFELIPGVTVETLSNAHFNGMAIEFSGGFRNYHLKPAAILASSFQEVLYLDDDNYLMDDPRILFDSPEYLTTGMLLWPDIWKANISNPVYDIFDVTCKEGYENESGQILVNKDIHYETLVLSYQILQQHDYWYKYLFGDKDVFRFAALQLLKPYYEVRRLPTFVGYRDEEEDFVCGLVFIHKWVDGRHLFFHANNAKYRGMISMGMFNKMQTHLDDTDLNIISLLRESKKKGCTVYDEVSYPNRLVNADVTPDVHKFLELWFSKIIETEALKKSLLE